MKLHNEESRPSYDTDLGDKEWDIIKEFLPTAKQRGRKRTDMRAVVNAILYLLLSPAHWLRMEASSPRLSEMADGVSPLLSSEERRNVEEDTRYAARNGTHARRGKSRTKRRDSGQSVGKNDGKRGPCGYDAGKKIKGRKRHILVDTLGLILEVLVHSANIQARDGARLILRQAQKFFKRLELVWADGGYAGKLIAWVKRYCKLTLEIVKRSDDVTGFHVLPRRWVVERTFGWFNRYRRLSKDYEYCTDTSETMIYLAMTHIMVRRLVR